MVWYLHNDPYHTYTHHHHHLLIIFIRYVMSKKTNKICPKIICQIFSSFSLTYKIWFDQVTNPPDGDKSLGHNSSGSTSGCFQPFRNKTYKRRGKLDKDQKNNAMLYKVTLCHIHHLLSSTKLCNTQQSKTYKTLNI